MSFNFTIRKLNKEIRGLEKHRKQNLKYGNKDSDVRRDIKKISELESAIELLRKEDDKNE